ncbi:DUF6088 family protein [Hyphomicrobium sp.]|uniref:DUF6088 family protein n=1 Tax=Hyphomicrobium sp. TaxID=82 RepID=UPI001D95BA3F|nr:hypothetical protein [Hyphomicrobium sp.]
MTGIALKIMNRVARHGRGARVYTAAHFRDLGSEGAVWQALSRLEKAGKLRRIARGLYDYPRHSKLLDTAVPASADAVAAALGAVAKDDLAAANALGVTTAVSVRPAYLTAGQSRVREIGNRTIELKRAPAWLLDFRRTAAMPIVQALNWLGDDLDDDAVEKLRNSMTPNIARALKSKRVPNRLREPIRVLTLAVT